MGIQMRGEVVAAAGSSGEAQEVAVGADGGDGSNSFHGMVLIANAKRERGGGVRIFRQVGTAAAFF